MASRFFVVAAFVLTLPPGPVIAQQSTPDPREAQIDKVVNGLNSLDPGTRLAAFEEAMAGSDATLRRLALSTAFASSDADLRTIALDKAMASVTTFVVQITGTGTSSCTGFNCKNAFQNGLGSSFEVRMAHFDASAGTFDGWSSFSGREETAASQRARASVWPQPSPQYEPITHPGSVAGGRLSFEVDASDLGGWTLGYRPEAHCSGVAQLEGGDAVLKGSMTCSAHDGYAYSDTENFSIEVNVLG